MGIISSVNRSYGLNSRVAIEFQLPEYIPGKNRVLECAQCLYTFQEITEFVRFRIHDNRLMYVVLVRDEAPSRMYPVLAISV